MAQKNETGLLTLRPVAWYRGLLPEKFGLPRQSGLVPELTGRVEMAEGFREREALRGLEGFSHVWLIWGFSQNHTWSPTCGRPGWEAIPGWGYLPLVLPSAPIL